MADSLLMTATPPILAFLLAKAAEIGTEQRVSRAYKRAQEEIAFWKAFVEAESAVCSQEQLDEVKQFGHKELESIRLRLLELRAPRTIKVPDSAVRRHLLLYSGRTAPAWAARVSFYAMIIYGFLLIAEMVIERSPKSWVLLSVECSWVLLAFALAVWSRRVALRVDARQATSS